jgi:hypothetical protein
MLFADYASLLRINGISWIIEENPKVAVGHILDALKPKPLQARVRDDLQFAHPHLKKEFLKFMDHAIERTEMYSDFEDSVVTSVAKGGSNSSRTWNKSQGDHSRTAAGQSGNSRTVSSEKTSVGKTKSMPDCLNPSCTEKHYLKECKNTL